jgi:hypothetical protein
MFMVVNGERPGRPEAIDFTPEIPFDNLWMLVVSCWAQRPDERPTGSDILSAIVNLQRQTATKPTTNDGQSSTTVESQIIKGRKHICQKCDEGFNSKSQLYDHNTVHHMKTSEYLMKAVLYNN